MLTVLISWSSAGKLLLILENRGRTRRLEVQGKHLDTVLLSSLSTILKKEGVPLSRLKRLGVVRQDMSLASLRLLLSAVNSLAWSLGLSIAWISQKQFENPKIIRWPKKTSLLKPSYARPAVITKSKK